MHNSTPSGAGRRSIGNVQTKGSASLTLAFPCRSTWIDLTASLQRSLCRKTLRSLLPRESMGNGLTVRAKEDRIGGRSTRLKLAENGCKRCGCKCSQRQVVQLWCCFHGLPSRTRQCLKHCRAV